MIFAHRQTCNYEPAHLENAMNPLTVERTTCTRIPTEVGSFELCHYTNNQDDKEHLALVYGAITPDAPLLVRMHSECFTGDVLGSLRCDCGPQLLGAMQTIAAAGSGIILYLRQEGRGIGLQDKLRAYNLQDMGYDTVDANLLLGHQADARDYSVAALMLQDLGVTAVRLLTNNPAKITSLERLGIPVVERVPLQTAVHAENAHYLQTKVARMQHLLQLESSPNGQPVPTPLPLPNVTRNGRPTITLSYAQSLDGALSAKAGQPTAISSPASLRLTHQLRATHQAILIGIGALLADNPRLTVRLADGPHPRPIILDSTLRTPSTAHIFEHPQRPLIATTAAAPPARQAALEAAGADIVRLPTLANGRISLPHLLTHLHTLGIATVMVEGGATVLASFLAAQLADRAAITLAPRYLGGLHLFADQPSQPLPQIIHPIYQQAGPDIILFGQFSWSSTP